MSEPNPFFGGSVPPPPPPPPSAFGPPVPAYGGDGRFGGPVRGFGAPAATFSTPRVASAPAGRPELVIVACTLLGLFAAFGLYVVVAASSVSGYFTAADAGEGPHIGAYVVTWGFSGALNIVLLIGIRQGNRVARIGTSILCTLWTLYWLHLMVTLGSALFAVGTVGTVVQALVIGMATMAALPAVVLWLPSSKRHFS